jgi:DNA polymerase III subunit delta
MDHNKIPALLTGKKIPPILYFYGEEDFFKEEAIKACIDTLVAPATRAFNYLQLYIEETSAEEIINSALALPMMAEKRVVVVRNIQRLLDSKSKGLVSYAAKPSETTCLIFDDVRDKPKGELFRSIDKKDWTVACKPLYEDKVLPWALAYTRTKNIKISQEGLSLLVQLVGNNIRTLANELDKAVIYAGQDKTVQTKDVEAVVGVSKNFTIYELRNQLGNKNMAQSLMIIDRLLEQGEEPVMMLNSLADFFTTLWKVRELLAKSMPMKDIAAAIKIHPFFARNYFDQAKRFSVQELKDILARLLEADYNLKRSYLTPKMNFEFLIYKICNLAPNPKAAAAKPAAA